MKTRPPTRTAARRWGSRLRRAAATPLLGVVIAACAPGGTAVPSPDGASPPPLDHSSTAPGSSVFPGTPASQSPVASSPGTATGRGDVGDRPVAVVALVGQAGTTISTVMRGAPLAPLGSLPESVRALHGLEDGPLLLTLEDGRMVLATAAQLGSGEWKAMSAPRLPAEALGPAAPVPDGNGGLVAVVPTDGKGALLVHLDAQAQVTAVDRIDPPLDGPFAALRDGRLLVVVRDARDRPVLAVIDEALGIAGLGVGAYDVDVAGETAALIRPPTTANPRPRLVIGPLAAVLAGDGVGQPVDAPPDVSPDAFALAPDGGGLVVTWRDDDDVLRFVSLLDRGADGRWHETTRTILPALTERALVGWLR